MVRLTNQQQEDLYKQKLKEVNIANINTQEIMDEILPNWEDIEAQNDIVFSNMLIFGFQGSGKSLSADWIINQAEKKYGKENVNAIRSRYPYRIIQAIENKKVNILVFEDATLRKISDDELLDFFNVRHIAKERGTLKIGYILNIINIHDFYSVKKVMRTTFDFMILCSSPTNQYDFNAFSKFTGKEILRTFMSLQKLKRKFRIFKRLKVFWYLGSSGYMETGIPSEGFEVRNLDNEVVILMYRRGMSVRNQLLIVGFILLIWFIIISQTF